MSVLTPSREMVLETTSGAEAMMCAVPPCRTLRTPRTADAERHAGRQGHFTLAGLQVGL